METIGARLKQIRLARGLKQSDVANSIGASISNISRIEKDEISPSAQIIIQICKYFDVSSDWLLFGGESNHNISENEARTNNPFPDLSKGLALKIYEAANGDMASAPSVYSLMEYDEDIMPKSVDFGVRINDNSMSPALNPGDIIFAKKASVLDDGSIGVFYIDGLVCCRKYLKTERVLLPICSDYKPLDLTSCQNFGIMGKALILLPDIFN